MYSNIFRPKSKVRIEFIFLTILSYQHFRTSAKKNIGKAVQFLTEHKMVRIDKKLDDQSNLSSNNKMTSQEIITEEIIITQFGSYKSADFVQLLKRLHRFVFSLQNSKNGRILNLDKIRMYHLFGDNFMENGISFDQKIKALQTMLSQQNLGE